MMHKNMKLTIPSIFKAIHDAEDDQLILKYNNMMMCMFISPILLLGSVVNILVRHVVFHRKLMITLGDSAIMLIFGLSFEFLLRADIKMKDKLKEHLIAALFAVFFIHVVARYYGLIGPSVWVFGIIPIVISMASSTRILWFYTGSALFFSWIYITFFAVKQDGLSVYYYILLFVFFGMLFFASFTVSNIGLKRIRKIRSQLQEVRMQVEVNKRLASLDQLTGLPNRTFFYEALRQAFSRSRNEGTPVYVLFLDLDMFKMINDTIGHTQGDLLLKQVGNRFQYLIGKSGMVARIGGDEFLILIQGENNHIDISNTANSILKQINKPFLLNERPFYITCSIGISKYPDDGTDEETIIKHADIALYEAKENGKNRYFFYSENLNQTVLHEMSMINDMRQALAQEEFELYYQPQMNGETDEIIGFEALMRWNHPTLGLLAPNRFISLAEQTELILPMGEWVLRTACAQNKAWQNNGLACVPIAVNLSIKQLCNSSLTKMVLAILQETGLAPCYLELEITEKVLIEDLMKIQTELISLKQQGVKIAIDDFGTGYSALQYLKVFPVDSIKIPIEFVRGIGINEKDESIITAILALAQIFKLEVIAEGVETKNQLDFLVNQSCKNIQGYYFSKPMKAADAEAFFKRHAQKGANLTQVRAET